MSPPDGAVRGPSRATPADISALNRVFAEAFTDRYRRDGMVGVRVPRLNPAIWRYALADAGEGAMVWRTDDDEVVAFNIAHHSGVEGWMGPLAVRPDYQGRGLGHRVVGAATEWLRGHHATTIGLETMPRTVDNIGFYSRAGFVPGPMTITLVGVADPRPEPGGTRLSDLGTDDRSRLLAAGRARLDHTAPGYDFTREFALTLEAGIGDGVVFGSDPVAGFALWHAAALVEGRPAEELRLLKVFADTPDTFAHLIDRVEAEAVAQGLPRVAVRCQSALTGAYTHLIDRGYRVRWTDLRMTLAGFPEAQLSNGEVLLSNWEI